MINVTKSFLPDKNQYIKYIDEIWERCYLTNNGPVVRQLEEELKQFLQVDQLYFCGNGTIVLQIALKALQIKGDVITTPFSYCATSNAILWENCNPVFVDIDRNSLNINADLIEAAITPQTTAIMATHVYGNPCDVDKISEIAKKHGLSVIYDAAHAFGVRYKGRSLFSYGDISTCSFHATKVFHTIEGGALISNRPELDNELSLLRAFGHRGDEEYYFPGINGKNSEFHAAMGLCNLPHVPQIVEARRKIFEVYDQLLNWDLLEKPQIPADTEYNYSYYPVIFPSEQIMLSVKEKLNKVEIFPRRYFYPSLNQLSFITSKHPCPVSETIAPRILALPLYFDLSHLDVARISGIINEGLAEVID